MPRKPLISPTKITTYLACPVKYGWTYLDPRGKWYLKSKSYYSFGSTLHKVLERFHDASDTGVTTVGEALTLYEDSWIDAGYQSAEEMAEAFGEGRLIIEKHVAETLERKDETKTLFVEHTVKMEFEKFVLQGRIDRIDELPDGTLDIIDYKSGRSGVTVEDVSADLAMSCYQLILQERYPDRKIQSTILALRSGQRASSSLSVSEMQVFKSDIEWIGNEIISTQLSDHVPTQKPLCPNCDFLPLCSKDQRWIDG